MQIYHAVECKTYMNFKVKAEDFKVSFLFVCFWQACMTSSQISRVRVGLSLSHQEPRVESF